MRLLLLLGLSLAAGAAQAGSFLQASSRGTQTAQFLSLGVGARAVAMGGAYSAVADDATALYWNTAALTRIPGRSATLMHASYPVGSYFEYAGYAQNLGAAGAFGTGIQYFSAGGITQTDASGVDTGVYTPYDLAVSAGYAVKARHVDYWSDLNGFAFGLSGKYIQSRVLSVAQTAAVDAGILSPGYFGDRLRLALTMTNFGGKMRFEQANEALPLTFAAGGAFQVTPSWLISLDGRFPRSDRPYVAVGTEYRTAVSGPWEAACRFGFSSETIGSIDGFTGVSMGLGIAYKSFSVDYAFVPFGTVGQIHRVSLSWKFLPHS